jgi:hypothetical protein
MDAAGRGDRNQDRLTSYSQIAGRTKNLETIPNRACDSRVELLRCMSPLTAQSGHRDGAVECLLSGAKQICKFALSCPLVTKSEVEHYILL